MKRPGGDYIGQSHSVIYSPGILVDQLFDNHGKFQRGPVLAVDTSPSKGPAYLPGHAELDAVILQLHPDAILLRGASATHTALLNPLPKASSFFFFGHGRRDSTGIALELGDGSKLHANEIRSGMLPVTRIVVLAACSSGNAENGLMDSGSLVRSFLAAGVPAVITSHWNVDSRSTAVFMQAFYKHLEMESPEHALLSARQEMRAQHISPFFWAAFNVAGQGI
jgi:CHAT domain-containing protein